jgi:hypothetical protein
MSLLTVYVGVVECAPNSLLPASSSLTHHAGWFDRWMVSATKTPTNSVPSQDCPLELYVGVVECAPASLPTQDGWFLQPKRRPTRLPRRTVPSNCICRCSRMRARASPPRVLLPHTCTQDGWFLQPKRRPTRLPRRTVPFNCICRCSRMRARLPVHILLLHTQVSR